MKLNWRLSMRLHRCVICWRKIPLQGWSAISHHGLYHGECLYPDEPPPPPGYEIRFLPKQE